MRERTTAAFKIAPGLAPASHPATTPDTASIAGPCMTRHGTLSCTRQTESGRSAVRPRPWPQVN